MNPGIVFICEHNGIVLNVHRDDLGIFGTPASGGHLSRYVTDTSKEAASRFFMILSNDGVSACTPIEFIANEIPMSLFCTGMRLWDSFLIFGAPTRLDLGALISGTLCSGNFPGDFSPGYVTDVTRDDKKISDYTVYEDLTRLNNELVDLSRELTDARLEVEMESNELNKENQVRRQAEEALEQANKKLNLLSGITRHDINNQLTVLRGFLSLLKKKQTDPSFDDYFLKIDASAQRISAMIQFTKTYENIGIQAPAWQEIRTLVDDAVRGVVLGDTRLLNDFPASIEILADPLIVKVFYNLMDNAVRYGGKIITIRFSIEERDTGLLLICQDDGAGIPADEKEKIFHRGFGKNTGLGLFLSREILSITGITIKETGDPGKGARFEMRVPEGMFRGLISLP